MEEGSVVVSDEWAGYRRLNEYGYSHYNVFHKRNYVDHDTGFHTQAIERGWEDAKVYIKRARGSGPLFQSHLDELVWRNANDGIDHPEKLLNLSEMIFVTYFSKQLDFYSVDAGLVVF